MKYEEYLKSLEDLNKEVEAKKIALAKEFALANNPHQVGDKVTDYMGTILIEKIGVGFMLNKKPCAIYYGIELKKDGTPKKTKSKRQVWQVNLLEQQP